MSENWYVGCLPSIDDSDKLGIMVSDSVDSQSCEMLAEYNGKSVTMLVLTPPNDKLNGMYGGYTFMSQYGLDHNDVDYIELDTSDAYSLYMYDHLDRYWYLAQARSRL